jgi:hypothetical protein
MRATVLLLRVFSGSLRDRFPVCVEAHHRGVMLRKSFDQVLLGEEHRHLGIVQHEPQALLRVVRIQRDIGPTALRMPRSPTAISRERSTQIPTRTSGPTPRALR